MTKFKTCLAILMLCLTGCQPSELELTEKQYSEAKQQGKLLKQLVLVDKLNALAPKKYNELANIKIQLESSIKLITEEQSKYIDFSTEQLAQLKKFSPNSALIKKIANKIKDKSKLITLIENQLIEVKTIQKEIKTKLQPTPAQIEFSATNIQLEVLANKLKAKDFWQNTINIKGEINSYQLESLMVSLIKLSKQLTAIESAQIKLQTLKPDYHTKSFQEVISDIEFIFANLYQQQLKASYLWVTKKNKDLILLTNTGLGRQQFEIFWQKSFEPAAKKAVLEAKSNQLALLEKIRSYAMSTRVQEPTFNDKYQDYPKVKALLVKLLWPEQGLYTFADDSEKVKAQLGGYIKI